MRGGDIIDEVRCSQRPGYKSVILSSPLCYENGKNIQKSAQFKRDFVRLTDSKRVLMKTSKAYEKVSDCLHVSTCE